MLIVFLFVNLKWSNYDHHLYHCYKYWYFKHLLMFSMARKVGRRLHQDLDTHGESRSGCLGRKEHEIAPKRLPR